MNVVELKVSQQAVVRYSATFVDPMPKNKYIIDFKFKCYSRSDIYYG